MVLISIYGLDRYCIGGYSKEHTSAIADLLECDKDEINFYCSEHYFFHEGVDQTSWNVLVVIKLDKKYTPLVDNLNEYIFKTLALFGIHITIKYEFMDNDYTFTHINDEYPRFITSSNIVNVEDEEEDEEDIDVTDEEKVFTGNIFQDFNKK